MVIKNKFNIFIGKLSQKTFRMNAIFFAALWIFYIVASYFATLILGMGGWSVIVTMPLAVLFYIAAGLAMLTGLVIYCFRKKTCTIIFYPKIFLWLLLAPQAVYILANPFRDCGDYGSCLNAS